MIQIVRERVCCSTVTLHMRPALAPPVIARALGEWSTSVRTIALRIDARLLSSGDCRTWASFAGLDQLTPARLP